MFTSDYVLNMSNNKLWTCPLCYRGGLEYGKRGCKDPLTCPEEKNINWTQYFKKWYEDKRTGGNVESVGIAEIANKEVE